VQKLVVGTCTDSDEFTFTLTPLPEGATVQIGSGTPQALTAAGFKLKKDQIATIGGLTQGVTYTVTETDSGANFTLTARAGGTNVDPDGISSVPDGRTLIFTNTRKTGQITVTKSVEGTVGTETFTFTIDPRPADARISINGAASTALGATFTLQHGQYATISSLEQGITYTVTETSSGANFTLTARSGGTNSGTNAITSLVGGELSLLPFYCTSTVFKQKQ